MIFGDERVPFVVAVALTEGGPDAALREAWGLCTSASILRALLLQAGDVEGYDAAEAIYEKRLSRPLVDYADTQRALREIVAEVRAAVSVPTLAMLSADAAITRNLAAHRA